MIQFEFHAYEAPGGAVASTPTVSVETLSSDSAARGRAGRLAKRVGGPVDLAFAGPGDWSERYITTAAPSEYHASGYRFERLED